MLKIFFLILVFGTGILLSSCKKKTDDFVSAPLNEYYPLEVGKYITYSLDSTIFINFGERDTDINYQVQDRVDAQLTDNTGKTVYRIIRLIRQNEQQDWSPNNTFMAVPTENSIEFVENNLRYIKLKLPITQDYTWKGNKYLPLNPYPLFDFGSEFLDDWDYTYQEVNAPLTIGQYNFDSTLTVSERDETLGDIQHPELYAERTYSIEKYAKGIGLVYREFLHWEYQGNTLSYKGFGIKLSIIDHN